MYKRKINQTKAEQHYHIQK